MKDFSFLHNNLFTTYMLEVEFPKHYGFEKYKDEARAAMESIRSMYDKDTFKKQNEHQFEDNFIAKVVEILGWQTLRQEAKIIQGKTEKPDFLLFTNPNAKNAYEAISKEERKYSNQQIAVIMESKAYTLEVDNKKIKDNPHFQLLRYLNNLKIHFGFLTNGRVWRFYDNSELSSQKIFYEVHLEEILEQNDSEAFHYFYHIFHARNFEKEADSQSTIQNVLAENIQSKITIENDLQSVIYGINGKESLFEKVGACIYDKYPKDLKHIYENALYFIFRLLFMAYFEDKFASILQAHRYKDKMSLHTLLLELKQKPKLSKMYYGMGTLEDIFRYYNDGKIHFDIPIFNGGLFDNAHTPLLQIPKIFDDEALLEILDLLFYYTDLEGKTFRRDYGTLSISHLGTIYEGLLSYFFEIANEDLCYLVYQPKKSKNKLSSIEGYFDSYDTAQITKNATIHAAQNYKKGQIYLKNTSNSRKSTASFYTPESITKFLVHSALDNALNDSNILQFKILDNACGSGHFLVEALNQITQIVQNHFDAFPALKKLYDEERQSIQKNICQFIENYEADESDILKRLLLKRMVFGVDLNPFSIELTKLSLWIDSFIFGTPLSFLEHHIKCGNALIGTTIAAFQEHIKQKQTLFFEAFSNEFNKLNDVFHRLDSIKDNTEAEIKESKRIYAEEISPTLTKLNLFLNALNAQDFMNMDERKLLARLENDNIEKLADSTNTEYAKLRETIESYAQKFRFFNYEIEFPEITSGGEFVGFQAIVGNPPWDKTKFSDSDFFPQYQSNYRTLSNTQKEEFRENLLAKDYIKREYEQQKTFINAQNEYYKIHYPLNRGSGDGNLFRFLVERNLELLAPHASLNYVLPSALMLEEGSYALRKEILENKNLMYFYSFENRDRIFHDIDSRYKFALMQICNQKPKAQHTIQTMYYKTKIESVYDKTNIIPLTLKDIKTLSPNQLALQEVRGKKDSEILRKCYAAFAPLSVEWLDFRNELHMTQDKDLFIEKDLFMETFGKALIPLYEGKMIHQFNAEFSRAQYFLNLVDFNERLRSKEIYRLKQDLGLDAKEYEQLLESSYPKTDKEKAENTFIKYDKEFYRLGFRTIASDTNERTLIFSSLPKNCGNGNSLWSSMPKRYVLKNNTITYHKISNLRLCFALGIFNSLVVDFIARSMIQINVNKTYLERIPLPQPSDAEILENPIYHDIALSALKLQLYNDKSGHFDELANEFGIDKSQIPSTQKLYDALHARLDITIAKLYGLDKEDFLYLLESFKVLCNNQPQYVALLRESFEENN